MIYSNPSIHGVTVTTLKKIGFPYGDNLLMTYLGGSHAHGAKIEGSADTDWFGVFVEPAAKLMGLDAYEHFVHTTGGKDGGNGPDDVDICFYSLRKWAKLAAQGNPSSLQFMFAAPHYKHPLWDYIKWKREAFLSRGHVRPFLGFADDQMKRLFGEKGQKNCHRKESEEKFGYDTKYAMHVIRLYGEAKELMEKGWITYPRPNAAQLIDIRLGKYTLSQIRDMGRTLEAEAISAMEKSSLPPAINREAVSEIIAEVYQAFWKGGDL